MNCTNCGGVMRLVPDRDYFVCDYCTAFHFPKENPDGVRLLGGETELECSLCAQPLVTASVAGHEALQCPRCEGILVYQDDFPFILRQRASETSAPPGKPTPINDEDRARRLDCPMCDRSLDLHPYYGPGHVLIDTCGECALIWLDRGEMEEIARASAHEWSQKR